MAIVNSCCCWLSLRVGSFICGFYTLIYYSVMLIVGFYQVDTWDHSLSNGTNLMYSLGPYADDSYPLVIVMVTSFGVTALTSMLLLIGVFLENRLLLLPWIVSLIFATFIGFIFTVFVLGMAVIHPFFPFMATIDIFFCLLNIYCALCVIALYQEYKSRGPRCNGHDNLQYQKENSSCDANKRSMTMTESDRASSRDPNSNQRRCSSPHPGFLNSSRRSSDANQKLLKTSAGDSLLQNFEPKSTIIQNDSKFISSSLEVKHLNDLGNRERRRSSGTNTKHVQFNPTIEEAPLNETDACQQQHLEQQYNGKS